MRGMMAFARAQLVPIRFVWHLLWSWPVVSVGSAVIYGFGVNAMYGDDFVVARASYFVALAWLAAKVLAWKEIRGQESRTAIRALVSAVAVAVFVLSLLLVRHREKAVAAAVAPLGAPQVRPGGLAGQVALKRKNRRIYGRVQDEVSGDAIVGAEVRVAGVSVVTDSLGLFEVNIPGELIQPELDCDVIAPSYLAGHFRVVPNSNEAVLPLKRGR